MLSVTCASALSVAGIAGAEERTGSELGCVPTVMSIRVFFQKIL